MTINQAFTFNGKRVEREPINNPDLDISSEGMMVDTPINHENYTGYIVAPTYERAEELLALFYNDSDE